MKLSAHFTLDEMTRTNTGLKNHVYRTEHYINLSRLVCLVLEPLRLDCGALNVTSGYRSPEVNKKVHGSPESRHVLGLAADIQSATYTPMELAEAVQRLGLPIDKIICEFNSWLHIQVAPAGHTNRDEYLIASKINGKVNYERMT